MSLQLLQIILQALSSSAIAGGLIFAAVQFHNARKAQHVANFTKLVELQMQLRKMRVDDPSLASVYRHDAGAASTDREIKEYFFNLMQVAVFEIVWFGYKHGQVPLDYYTSWERRMREIATEPSFRRMMKSGSMKIMHDEFQHYMTAMVDATPGALE